jgi:hypothetical protein
MKRASILVAAIVVWLAIGAAPAMAAPNIMQSGLTRTTLAWGLASQRYTQAWIEVEEPGYWLKVDVMSSAGIVKTLYDGPGSTVAFGEFWVPTWNGKDYRGRYLPNGQYIVRMRATKAGQAAEARHIVRVCRSWFVIQGTPQATMRRYLYGGWADVWWSVANPGIFAGTDPVMPRYSTNGLSAGSRVVLPVRTFEGDDTGFPYGPGGNGRLSATFTGDGWRDLRFTGAGPSSMQVTVYQ